MRLFDFDNFFGCALGNEFAAGFSGFRSEVDHMVGALYNFKIMLNDKDGIACLNKCIERFQELCYVVVMKSRCRLIEDKERAFL